MVTFFQAFMWQIQRFLIGSTLYLIRHFLSGDKRNVSETFPDALQNTYFLTYLIVLWFGFFTWLTWYVQMAEYGIWSYLLLYNSILGWMVIVLVAIANISMILIDRYYPKD